ncbi:MAG: polymerase sigma 70 [Caulobacter sp.]|nr:polymerase sigma 70 [Caulobacter sp.]
MASTGIDAGLAGERRFMARAMGARLLPADEERSLAVRWRDGGDEAALHELTHAYMRLVIALARRFTLYGLPMGDLVQEGAVGLMQAAARFDPEREVRFSTYAGWWVRAAMQDYVLRNWSIVRTGTTASGKTLFFNLRRLRARLGDLDGRLSPAARVAIAADLGVSEDDVAAMAARLSAGDRSLNAPVGEAADMSWEDTLESDAPLQDEIVMGVHDAAVREGVLARALTGLNPRELEIVRRRRLSDEPETLEVIGARLGVSKERVRQIEGAALAKIKAAVVAEVGDPVEAGIV